MTDLREAIARAIVSAGYNPATAPAIADAVLAILPDAEALADALAALIPSNLGDNSAVPDDATIPVDMTMGEIRMARTALANYRKGTGREG